jgi:hypothetical protein
MGDAVVDAGEDICAVLAKEGEADAQEFAPRPASNSPARPMLGADQCSLT